MFGLGKRLSARIVESTERHHFGFACWEYTGQTITGYYRRRRDIYRAIRGDFPSALVLDHLCRNSICVNPFHAEPVTQAVNLERAPTAIATVNAAKTHCRHGHEFTPENTYWSKNRNGRPMRQCRACHAARARVRNLRNKRKDG
jgi:hypothetical protein